MEREYYASHYPYDRVERLLRAIDPSLSSELLVRASHDAVPLRHQEMSSLRELVHRHTPRDGVHLALSASGRSTLVLDVDSDGARPLLCECGELGRSICDNCWLALAGAMRGYAYMLRTFFGCRHLLACFSGGRGWHMFVLDAAHLDHAHVTQILHSMVPDSLRRLSSAFLALHTRVGQQNAIPLRTFDPVHRLRGTVGAENEVSLVIAGGMLEQPVLELFTAVLLPYFLEQWRLAVLGASSSQNSALSAAVALLRAQHDTHQNCENCVVWRACRIAHESVRQPQQFEQRIDVFLAVCSLLWQRPDMNMLGANHPIRLPWSPHDRSQRFSLPLTIDTAHQLAPMRYSPLLREIGVAHTAAHSLFQQSLRVVDDLLDEHRRSPSALGVWPT